MERKSLGKVGKVVVENIESAVVGEAHDVGAR